MKLIMENWKRFLKESRDEYPEDEDLDVEPWSPEQKKRFNREWDALEKENPAPEIEVDLDEEPDYAELALAKMEPTQRNAFIEATREAIRDHLHPGDEGTVDYVLDRAGMPDAQHLAPLVSLFLDDPGVLFDIRQKLELGEVDPDDAGVY